MKFMTVKSVNFQVVFTGQAGYKERLGPGHRECSLQKENKQLSVPE